MCAKSRYSAARQEQFASFDEAIKEAALAALTGFTKALAQGVSEGDDDGPLRELLDPMISEGVRHLSDFDMGFVRVQTRLMCSSARASPVAATQICQQYIPKALEKRADPGTIPENRSVYVQSVRDIVSAVSQLRGKAASDALGDVGIAVLDAANSTIAESDPATCKPGLACLASLFEARVLQESDAAAAIPQVVLAAKNGERDGAVLVAARDALQSIARNYPEISLKHVVPTLANSLGQNGDVDAELCVEALVAVAVDQPSR